jgi:VanZ family protein
MADPQLLHAPVRESGAPSETARARGWIALCWPAVIASLIFIASSRARVATPDVTRVDDKVVHFAVYGLMATLVCRVGRNGRAALWAFLAVSVYGASDEWHQSLVPGRAAEVADWIADTLGAAVAVALYWGWPAYRRLLEMPLGRRGQSEKR